MASIDHASETLRDLFGIEAKAELIRGRIVRIMPTGRFPNRVAGNIYLGLRRYEQEHGWGEAFTDNAGFFVAKLHSGRESFAPDASYSFGPFPENAMRFLPVAPTFAVEVRSENDYGPAAEREMAAKRVDYFEAGTVVVWDVDPISRTIRSHRGMILEPHTFGPGDLADAEPALPGWRIVVDEIFA